MINFKKFNFLFLLYFFVTTHVHAYIDPGGISAFVQILFASIVTSIIFLKGYIGNFFQKILNFFHDFKVFFKVLFLKEKTFIYYESNTYSIYFYEVLKQLKKKDKSFVYLCKSKDENVSKLNLEKQTYVFNGNFLLLTIISTLVCNNLILTTPDFGNHKLKLSKKIKNIVYIFHSAVSTNMIYKNKAFNNYNTICCVGDHHINELNEKFNMLGIKNKLVKCGYPYLDHLLSYAKQDLFLKKNILFAPSWYPENPNYYEENYTKLILEIVKNDFKVTFRPHPEYLKRFEKEFFKFTKNFSDFDNFITSVDSNNYSAMEKSEFLLTDWSGIAFEFAYAFKRPVVFLDAPKKILNTDFAKSLHIPIEVSDREEIGVIFNKNTETRKITDLLNKISNEKNVYKDKIVKNLNKNIFNIGSSSTIIDLNLI